MSMHIGSVEQSGMGHRTNVIKNIRKVIDDLS
jgi:hypothetical protein